MKQKRLVPKRRFEEFMGDWEELDLGEVVQITMGQSPSSESYTDNPSDYILVQGNADMKDNRVFPRVWTKQVTKLADKGDLILSVRAPVGDIGKTDYEVVLGRGVAGVKGNDFIFQLLVKMKKDNYWSNLSTGSTFDSINSNDIKEALVLIPEEDEQQKIGQFFKHLDEMIALEQRKIDKTKALKAAYLAEMFPAEGKRVPKRRFAGFTDEWKSKTLKELRDENDRYSFTGGPFGSDLKSEDYTKSGVRIIQLQNIGDGYFLNKYKIYTSEQKAKSLSTNLIYPNEIIIAKMAEPLARAAIIPDIESKYLMASDGIRLKVDTGKFHLYFILTLINGEVFRKKALENSSGTTRKRIGLVTLGNLSLNIPKYKEQKKIGAFFKKVDDTILNHQKKLEKLKAIKQAYLHEMFV